MSGQRARELRSRILDLVAQYRSEALKAGPYAPGDRIPYAARVFDDRELVNLVDASLDFWLTAGQWCAGFEKALADWLGVSHLSLTNSGSSANLLAFSALTSPKLGDRAIGKGHEVITVAAGFPTTVAPIVQHGAVPVFVDIELPSYNVDPALLESAVSDKTRAVMLAHTLGNPFDLAAVTEFCDTHGLWLIEDNCDALGATFTLKGETRYTGTFGHLGTSSFYPPHHMTTGEGGAVYTDSSELKRLVESFRDWGRDCWCASGQDNACGRRFSRQMGELPHGYDHKYTYSHFGYNLRVTEMQAAIGMAQLEKLPGFVESRRRNWEYLRESLDDMADVLVLPEPQPGSRPSWFGFLLTVRRGAPFTRDEIVQRLEDAGIQTRMLFAGNLIRHPCFDRMRETGQGYRVVSSLETTDRIMRDAFWVGVYPGLTEPMLEHMVLTLRAAGGR
jgi:CDP-6-deoxy-D-xylo-4-hexulose-3-dehydrase